MKFNKIPYEQVGRWSKRDLAFIQREEALRSFVGEWVSLEALRKQMDQKSLADVNRTLLVSVLQEQYHSIETSDAVLKNIELLGSKNTFTIVTAHQPSLMTGPLYYIYKICSTINLCRQLCERFSEYYFVPIFISGGEDHDLEEVNHFQLYGKDITWQRDQAGSVGRMDTAGIGNILEQTFETLSKTEHAEHLKKQLISALEQSGSYGDFQSRLVNEIFRNQGLVFINMDNAKLKKAFIPILEKELFEEASHDPVNQTIAALTQLGYKSQASPREINLFYLGSNFRERIIKAGGVYKVNNQDISFTTAQIKAELYEHPERFSPNVVVRPLYQEYILPNLAYIGGGGEIAYWTERKSQFESFGIPFPLLIRRNSAMIINQGLAKQMNQVGFGIVDIFKETHILERAYLDKNPDADVDFSEETNQLKEALEKMSNKAKLVDPTLERAALGETTKILKGLEHLQNKIVKAEKKKHEVSLNKISKIHNKLFPENGLQERKDNFLPYFVQYGSEFIDELIHHLDPLEGKFTVVHLD